ncbi:MAG: hypothetical protein L6R48_02000 [Planctomycetes bacterium]|nr:hypothetical protein [Planctomycetota bacterium]
MKPRNLVLGVLLLVAVIAAVWVWRASTAEPLAGFRDFPWTYIAEGAAGYDDTRVLVVRGEITGPASTQEAGGATAWPAYFHPDPAVVPQQAGKPYLFPLIPAGNAARTPVIAPLKRALTAREIATAQRFMTGEGEERMARFRKEMGQ